MYIMNDIYDPAMFRSSRINHVAIPFSDDGYQLWLLCYLELALTF